LKTGDRKTLNVLFTCIGRRVSLLNSFRRAARQLKMSVRFFGADTSEMSAALQLCDKKLLVKPIGEPGYIPQLLEIVKENKIVLLVPTIDTDLVLLAENKTRFAKLGCRVFISEPKVVHICQDKRKTYHFLTSNGFDAPVTIPARTALGKRTLKWPVLAKPWDVRRARVLP
jgi:carbamoyl-phosphate synthase large subunit